ncbi:MAG TPA: ABC transporter permease, partial [Acidobacteriota bacterium]|nr:ABC transporter permease [Acidobacteriota bacterium]
MDRIWQDIRYAMRTFIRRPAFAAAAVVTLALGIGANTAIFSVIDASMLRPLPFREPGRLAELWWYSTQAGYSTPVQNAAAWMEWRQHTDLFQQVEAYETAGMILRGLGRPETIQGIAASAGVFELLGVPPLIGRTYESGEEGVVVLAYDLWQKHFAGDPSALGQTITLDDQPYSVIGVMPSDFRFPYRNFRLWRPYRLSGTPEERLNQPAVLLVRMHEGDSIEVLQERVDAVTARLDEEKPLRRSWSSKLYALQRGPSPKTRTALMVLLGAVGLVLLIACANAANLMLSQSGRRSRATAIRAALGAGRMRLLRLMLTESLLLAFAGAALGAVLSLWTVDLIMGMAPSDISLFQLNTVR